MDGVKKSHLKDKKAKDRDEHKDTGQQEQGEQPSTPRRDDKPDPGNRIVRTPTPPNDRDEDMHQTDKAEAGSNIHPKRVWGKKGTMTSTALYAIATTPQRVGKDPASISANNQDKQPKRKVDKEAQDLIQQMKDLSLQMRQELEHFRSAGTSSSSEQVNVQQENIIAQIQKLTDIANRHDDEIDDLRGMSDFTHEIVIKRENKEMMLKMVIKAWPSEASYYDRVRITDWLLQQAGVANNAKQEHGYYGAGRKFTLSPVTILTFYDEESHHRFEKYTCGNFSQSGRCTIGMRKVTMYNIGKEDGANWLLPITLAVWTLLTINLALVTVLHILTSYPDTGYTGMRRLSHRPTDKQIFDLDSRKVVAKVTYDKDRGVLAIIVQGKLIELLETTWHEAWKTTHKDHPRYYTYNRFPYAVS